MSKQELNGQDIERFEAYYYNRLNDAERMAFEELLRIDADLSASYNSFTENLVIVESLGVRDLMKEVIAEKQSRKPKTMRMMVSILSIAASIVIGFFIFKPLKPDSNELFEQYFNTYPDLYSTRAGTNNESLTKGLTAYQSEDFETALHTFESLNLNNDTLRLYIGTSQLFLGQLEGARATLNQIESPLFQEAKVWYLGLSYLKSNQADSLKFYFESIRDSSSYSERAGEILDQY